MPWRRQWRFGEHRSTQVPGEEVLALGRQAHAAHKPASRGAAGDGLRAPPADARARLGRRRSSSANAAPAAPGTPRAGPGRDARRARRAPARRRRRAAAVAARWRGPNRGRRGSTAAGTRCGRRDVTGPGLDPCRRLSLEAQVRVTARSSGGRARPGSGCRACRDVREVPLHRLRGDEQGGGHLFGLQPLGHQPRHAPFGRGRTPEAGLRPPTRASSSAARAAQRPAPIPRTSARGLQRVRAARLCLARRCAPPYASWVRPRSSGSGTPSTSASACSGCGERGLHVAVCAGEQAAAARGRRQRGAALEPARVGLVPAEQLGGGVQATERDQSLDLVR